MAPTMFAASSAPPGGSAARPRAARRRRARACRRGTSRLGGGDAVVIEVGGLLAWSANLPSEKDTKSAPVTIRTTVVHHPANPLVRGHARPRAGLRSHRPGRAGTARPRPRGRRLGPTATGRVPAEHDPVLVRRLRRRCAPRARGRSPVTSSLSRDGVVDLAPARGRRAGRGSSRSSATSASVAEAFEQRAGGRAGSAAWRRSAAPAPTATPSGGRRRGTVVQHADDAGRPLVARRHEPERVDRSRDRWPCR